MVEFLEMIPKFYHRYECQRCKYHQFCKIQFKGMQNKSLVGLDQLFERNMCGILKTLLLPVDIESQARTQ